MMPRTPFTALLRKSQVVAIDTLFLTFEAQDCTPESLHPGQLLLLLLEPKVVRAYSLASSPELWPHFSLLVKLLPGGRASTLYREASVGQKFSFLGPAGQLLLEPLETPMKLYATGTGLAPFLGFLDRYHTELLAPVSLSLGLWGSSHVPLIEQLRSYREESSGLFSFSLGLTTLSPGDQEDFPEAYEGYCTRDLEAGEIDLSAHYALCGNPSMVSSATQMLQEAGLPMTQLKREQW